MAGTVTPQMYTIHYLRSLH